MVDLETRKKDWIFGTSSFSAIWGAEDTVARQVGDLVEADSGLVEDLAVDSVEVALEAVALQEVGDS